MFFLSGVWACELYLSLLLPANIEEKTQQIRQELLFSRLSQIGRNYFPSLSVKGDHVYIIICGRYNLYLFFLQHLQIEIMLK